MKGLFECLSCGPFILGSVAVVLTTEWQTIRFGIYGPSMAGKTARSISNCSGRYRPNTSSLGLHMHTTRHTSDTKCHRLEENYKMEKGQKAISNNDIGGQSQFRNLRVEDMIGRNVEVVIFMIDHRVLTNLHVEWMQLQVLITLLMLC